MRRDSQAQWFAHSAYNAGLAAGLNKDSPSAAVLYSASATFSSAMESPTAQSLTNQKVLSRTCDLFSSPHHGTAMPFGAHMRLPFDLSSLLGGNLLKVLVFALGNGLDNAQQHFR